MFLGLRGFPAVQGGIESHAERLCPILARMGCRVEVVVRSRYVGSECGTSWEGVRYLRLWSPRSKRLEAIVHTFLGVLVAAIRRPDVLHIHAIGPALMVPLARVLGLRVVVTHHGQDYDRQKWGGFAKMVLRLGERAGMRWSNARIAISRAIVDHVRQTYSRDCLLIPNGVSLPEPPITRSAVDAYGLTPGRYVLLVSRLVPEKRHCDLIEAFRRAGLAGWRLAIVGGADHPDAYSRQVVEEATRTHGVVCTGFLSGTPLHELYAHAGMFVLPSSHEGLPISMLEALSYGLPVIASDIPANREIGLPADSYFPVGDVDRMAKRIAKIAAAPVLESERAARRAWVASRFDWHSVARQTLEVYRGIGALAPSSSAPATQGGDDADEAVASNSYE
jgi:glycosyltransferase involved in cell wall biosynthesis